MVRGTDIPRSVTRGDHVKVRDGEQVSPALYTSIAQNSSDPLMRQAGAEIHHVVPLYLGGGHNEENLLRAGGSASVADSAHRALHELIDSQTIQFALGDGDNRLQSQTRLSPNSIRSAVPPDRLEVMLGTLYKGGTIDYDTTGLRLADL